MTIFLLALLGAAEPSGLLADPSPRRVQLVADEPRVYEGWTDAELRAELDRLEDERPALGLPFGLLGGGVLALGGLGGYLEVVFRMGGGFNGPGGTLWAGMFGVAGLVALGVACFGALLLGEAFPKRKAIDRVTADVLTAMARGAITGR